jgi:hypothetical protein
MSGLHALGRRFAALRKEATETNAALGETPKAAAEAVDAATDGLREVAEEAAATYRRLGFASGSRSVAGSVPPAGGVGAGTGGAIGGGGEEGEESGALAPQFTQQEILDEIRNTTVGKAGVGSYPIGQLVDRYIELFTELLVKGAAQTLTPARQAMIERALYANDIGAQDLIRTFAGAAGRKINFSQLEADIKKILRAQQEAARATRNGRSLPRSSGSLGTSKPETCGNQTSLSTLLNAGALR